MSIHGFEIAIWGSLPQGIRSRCALWERGCVLADVGMNNPRFTLSVVQKNVRDAHTTKHSPFILPLSPFTFHLSPFIFHLSSFIFHLSPAPLFFQLNQNPVALHYFQPFDGSRIYLQHEQGFDTRIVDPASRRDTRLNILQNRYDFTLRRYE